MSRAGSAGSAGSLSHPGLHLGFFSSLCVPSPGACAGPARPAAPGSGRAMLWSWRLMRDETSNTGHRTWSHTDSLPRLCHIVINTPTHHNDSSVSLLSLHVACKYFHVLHHPVSLSHCRGRGVLPVAWAVTLLSSTQSYSGIRSLIIASHCHTSTITSPAPVVPACLDGVMDEALQINTDSLIIICMQPGSEMTLCLTR